MMNNKENIDHDFLIQTCVEAGNAIMAIYNDPETSQVVDFKGDDSPLTLADQKSHEVIDCALKTRYPEIPVISEEGDNVDYEVRKDFDTFWLVDPLDGTKEFINRNGEFTVNIALIKDGIPVAGYIFVPAKNITYYGIKEQGAMKRMGNEPFETITVSNKQEKRIAVRSKSHASPEEDEVLNKYGVVDFISVGSSLKFCMVAEGKADLYYRHGPTMEWDTAAGQAILESAGGKAYNATGPDRFTYNKESLLNGSFLCLGF